MSYLRRISYKILRRKPRTAFLHEEDEEKLDRNLSAWDLIAVGVGGTVGSGIFVLAGLIANAYAGPGVVGSWIIAGVGCIFSAMSYAEMSCRIPSSGSSYAYAYYALGELPAVIAAACLTLEYGIAGAAVARSWGDKLIDWTKIFSFYGIENLNTVYGVNIYAGILQFLCSAFLLLGTDVGKSTINIFTIIKILLIAFMIICGFSLFLRENLQPLLPYGTSGVLRGATSAFFGFIGYDEVCCLAAEAKNPQKTLPIAIFGTIGIVTVLYLLASLALIGMMPYDAISPTTGFSTAFLERGLPWAQQLVALGELCTLPLVVVLSIFAQPRILFAMAQDGLMPKVFSDLSKDGVMVKNILISGGVATLIALFVPFSFLNEVISAGVLISFNLTNSAVVLVRRGNRQISGLVTRGNRCAKLLFVFHVQSLITAVLLTTALRAHDSATTHSSDGQTAAAASSHPALVPFLCISAGATAVTAVSMWRWCPESEEFPNVALYRVPLMPFTPLLGILVNYILLMQLSSFGLLCSGLYICLVVLAYSVYSLLSGDAKSDWVLLRSHANSDNNNNNNSGEENVYSYSFPPMEKDNSTIAHTLING